MPMATSTPPKPSGNMGSKRSNDSAGEPAMAAMPNAMKSPMTLTLARVMMLPASPVSDAPRRLMPRNTTTIATPIQRSKPITGTSGNDRPTWCSSSCMNDPNPWAYSAPATAWENHDIQPARKLCDGPSADLTHR